jgi:hypothetical protein
VSFYLILSVSLAKSVAVAFRLARHFRENLFRLVLPESRETELAAEYPIHVACEWIGNSPVIAAKHYLTVREEDFGRATQGGAKSDAYEAQFKAQQASAT